MLLEMPPSVLSNFGADMAEAVNQTSEKFGLRQYSISHAEGMMWRELAKVEDYCTALANSYLSHPGRSSMQKSGMEQLGSGLMVHNQSMTIAAIAMADMNVWAQRSSRVWMRLRSFSLANMVSILWRFR